MRAPLMLITGLAVGITGTVLFQTSFPPPAGSVEAENADLERELTKTRVELAAAEARAPGPGLSTKQKLADGARDIVEELKAGHPVDMNDVYRAAKPALRDFSPIFERLQRRDLLKRNEHTLDDLTRKYHLAPARQESLREWLKAKTEKDIAEFREFSLRDKTSLEDIVKTGHQKRPDDGLEVFMENTLSGRDREQFKTDRLNQKVARVQEEADRRVSRLNRIVVLDEGQQDQVFALMARSSPDFDPSMQLEGLGSGSTQLSPGQSRDEAILNVLRPEQQAQYEEARQERLAAAQNELDAVGLKFPENWDMFLDD